MSVVHILRCGRLMPYLFAFFFLFLVSLTATGQQATLKFDRLTTENYLTVKGLSQNSIYCILQDSKGFIWLGTWDGLNKYDGYKYIIYNTTNGLSNPTINAILEDDEKNIWIGTDNGLNKLNRATGGIEQFHQNTGGLNSISNDFINYLFQDNKGYLWISTAFGLNRFDKSKRIFTCYNFFERDADSSSSNYITRVKEDESGKLWIATHRGIHSFDPEKLNFRDYKMESEVNENEYVKGNYVQDITFDGSGNLYAATLNGVYVINPGEGVIHHFQVEKDKERSLSGNQVNALLIDGKGSVWIGTSRGLDIFEPSLNLMTSIKAGGNITSLSNNDIRSIYQDQAGTIWVGTYRGLNKVDRNPSRFTHFRNDPDNPRSLSDNIVYSILEDENGLVWIGTYGGVNIFNRVNETFAFLRHDPDDPESISSDKIRTLSLDSAGFIWIGTESSGMNRLDRSNKRIKRFQHDPDNPASISENNILSSIVDSKGRIWVGTVNKGVNIIDDANGKTEMLSADPASKILLSDNKIWSIYEDRHGNIWLGTNEGLNKLSPDLRTVEVYIYDPSVQNSISSNRVLSIYEDDDGIYWIGTMGGGLNRFDPVNGIFKTYNEHDGLPSSVVYAVLDDHEGNLWISTNQGLSKFSKLSATFVNYDTKDGVQGNEFNAGAYFKNSKGEMFFGGMNGINVFHPSEISQNMVPPRIVFTGFTILNALVDDEPEEGEIIRLEHTENFFSIEFSALDYTNPSKNLYRYKLENYDNDWRFASSSQREAEYRKVDPGTYRFLVTGSNNDGIWNHEGISLTIVIRPPWWRTWIFRLTAGLLAITLIWGLIIIRIRNMRRKHEVEKKMLTIEKQVFELEQKALRLQMNPHFIFNSLNAIQNFVLSNDTDKAVNYLAKFSHLMRMILANSTAALITLKDELKALTHYMDLEKLRFDDKFDYQIIRDPSVDEEFVEIPPMLFQPFVENAIIHGLVNSPKRGILEISMQRVSPGILRCTIKDNGIGREKAIEIRNRSGIKRQPKGMIITQERIEIFNKQNRKNFAVKVTDLKDGQGEPAGTMVEFTIQYKEI
jgi:ligand-binding sensor domain-containing protein